MVEEKYLSEEEFLEELKIDKVQLESWVKEGKVLPVYQQGARKFKQSEISKLSLNRVGKPMPSSPPPPAKEVPPPGEEPAAPQMPQPAVPPPPPLAKETPPPGKEPVPSPVPPGPAVPPTPPSAKETPAAGPPQQPMAIPRPVGAEEGSTRVIQPPKGITKIGVKRQEKKETPGFLKPPEKEMELPKESLWARILLIVTLVISLFSVGILYFGLSAKEFPPRLQEVVDNLGAKLTSINIGPEEGPQIAEEAQKVLDEVATKMFEVDIEIEVNKEFVAEKGR